MTNNNNNTNTVSAATAVEKQHHAAPQEHLKATEKIRKDFVSEKEERVEESPWAGAAAGITRTLTRVVASLGRTGIAGTMAGLSEEVAAYPLDTVKTKMQVHEHHHKAGFVGTLKHIVGTEGVSGLFRGLTMPIIGSAFFNAILFGLYERSLSEIKHRRPNSGLEAHFFAGAVGGLGQVLVTCPVDVIRYNMMGLGGHGGHGHAAAPVVDAATEKVVAKQPPGLVSAAKDIVKNRGVLGLYQGIVPTIFRDTPGYGIYFFTYEYMKRMLAKTKSKFTAHASGGGDNEHEHVGFLGVLASGGTAGVVYHAATHPFDVVKSIIQTQSFKDGKPEYRGMVDCFRKTYAANGVKGLYRGIAPTLLKSFPASAAGFAVYELTLQLLP